MDRRESASSSGLGIGTKAPFVFGFDGWRLDLRRRLLTSPTDEAVSISSTAYAVLVQLVQRSGELVTRTELMRAVWPTTIVEENNLNQAVASLRRALGEGYIATVPGQGYQFIVPVSLLVATEGSGAISSVTGTGASTHRAAVSSAPNLSTAPSDLPPSHLTGSWLRTKAAIAILAALVACSVG